MVLYCAGYGDFLLNGLTRLVYLVELPRPDLPVLVTESTSRLARARSCDFKQRSEQSVCIGLGVVSSIFQCSNLQKSRFCL